MANLFYIPSGPLNLQELFPDIEWKKVKDYYLEILEDDIVVATTPTFKIGCCCGDGSGLPVPDLGEITCNPLSFISDINLPDISESSSYFYVIYLGGTAPFVLSSIVKPSWMTIEVVDDTIVFSGTATGLGDNTVTFTVSNCSGANVINFESTFTVTAECISVGGGTFAPPDGETGVPYSYYYVLSGSDPFSLSGTVTKPSWMTVNIVGNLLSLTGTPTVGGSPTISLTVVNCLAETPFNLSDTINICERVTGASTAIFPDGEVGIFYNQTIMLFGTQPFVLGSIVKPSWMTIDIVDDLVTMTGTPDATGSDLEISFIATNCSTGSHSFSTTINVV